MCTEWAMNSECGWAEFAWIKIISSMTLFMSLYRKQRKKYYSHEGIDGFIYIFSVPKWLPSYRFGLKKFSHNSCSGICGVDDIFEYGRAAKVYLEIPFHIRYTFEHQTYGAVYDKKCHFSTAAILRNARIVFAVPSAPICQYVIAYVYLNGI